MKFSITSKPWQVLSIGSLLLLGHHTFAQDFPFPQTKNVIPPAPTSVQFQRYGDYPVGTFTGVPDISIPIFTIKSGDLTLPISLNYHASGSRGDDVSGFVGYGWTLMAGGEMSRTIIGKPDDISQVAGTQPTLNITPENASQLEAAIQPGGIYGGAWWVNYLKTMDHEYDLYSYSVPGKSGKFVNNTPLDYRPITIQPQYMRDENGIEYNFNDLEYQDYDDAYYQPGGGLSFISTMHLTSIVSRTSSIGLTYQDGPNYTHNSSTDNYMLDDFWEHNYDIYSGNSFQYTIPNSGGINNSGSLIKYHPRFVKSISWQGGTIKFIEDPNTYMLSSVQIYDAFNQLIKTVTLNIVLFATAKTTTPDPTFRYKLASVAFDDVLNNHVQTYTFNYINEGQPDAVGDLWSNHNDHWGFYNGQTGLHGTNLSSYSYMTNQGGYDQTTTIGDGKIKDPDPAFTMNYVLNKIIYPTGGYTVFDYEGNRANIGYTNVAAGGLRVKRITNYNADGTETMHKAYTYPANGGYQEVAPSMDLYYYTQDGYTEQDPAQYPCHFRRTFLMTDPMVDLSPQGASVVYSSVSEDDGNMAVQYNYDFGNAYEYPVMNSPVSEIGGTDGNGGPVHNKRFTSNYRPWNFGNLLSKVTTGTSNGVTTSTMETNEYEEYIVSTIRDMKIERNGFATFVKNPLQYNSSPLPPSFDANYPEAPIVADINNFDQLHPEDYNISDHYYLSGGKRLIKTTTTYATSNGSTALVSEKDYHYDNPNYPSVANRIVTTNSKGESITTQLKFPYDYSTTHPYDDMVSINQTAPMIEQTVTNTTLNKELSHSKANYDYFPVIPLSNPSGQTGYIGPKTLQKSVLGNTLDTEVSIDAYDPSGNVRQVTGRDGIITTYLYGYSSLYPVAKIVGKDYNTVSTYVTQSVLDNPSSDAAMLVQLNALRTSLPDAQVSTYTYKPLVGMTTATDPKGKITYYEYDSFQRLQTIRDQDGKILKSYTYNYQH